MGQWSLCCQKSDNGVYKHVRAVGRSSVSTFSLQISCKSPNEKS